MICQRTNYHISSAQTGRPRKSLWYSILPMMRKVFVRLLHGTGRKGISVKGIFLVCTKRCGAFFHDESYFPGTLQIFIAGGLPEDCPTKGKTHLKFLSEASRKYIITFP